jgi:aldehyde dehydrogenase (NAD+)
MWKKTDLEEMLDNQRAFFSTGKTKDVKNRIIYLKKLKESIKRHENEICDALAKDFGKAPFETYMSEIGTVLVELRHIISHLKKWAKPKRGKTPLTHLPGKSRIYAEPYGTVLVISPWNYPFNLAMVPVMGALSAGNTVFLKTASETPETAMVLEKILSGVFPPEWVTVLRGSEVKKFLLDFKYDYIFFTGGPYVGRVVMEKAAAHLTPVTLELGGKSPCIVMADADLALAAKRIAWGKFFNSGQTCIAPDYLLIEEKVKPAFFEEIRKAIKKLYGDNPDAGPDFARIINDKHWKRIEQFLHKGKIVAGGRSDAGERYIEPSVIDGISPDDPVMQEEIFGPVLPAITVKSIDDAVKFINEREKPLALYLFTKSNGVIKKVIGETSYGGGCINDTLMHFANGYIPFGGVGNSGMGAYHGKLNFDTFTHYKSVYYGTAKIFDNPFRYAPYTDFAAKIIKAVLR